jgi:hypothetical protein
MVQHGSLEQSPAASGLALAAPALAVSRQGVMMVAATYSGAGKVKGSSGPAYPGEGGAGQKAARRAQGSKFSGVGRGNATGTGPDCRVRA